MVEKRRGLTADQSEIARQRFEHEAAERHRLGEYRIARGIYATRVSIYILVVTALLQVVVVYLGRSVGLLADTLHNAADALTALPLWFAFALSRRRADSRFTYGYSRFEDLAGVLIVFIIVVTGFATAYQGLQRLQTPLVPSYLGWGIAAGILGIIGNETVAAYRIRVGREIGSLALITDGEHSRIDGLTSLAALLGLIGAALGYPRADAAAALVITVFIFGIAVVSTKKIVLHLVDAVEPGQVERVQAAIQRIGGIQEAHNIRARWTGHRQLIELHVVVDGDMPLRQAHDIGEEVRRVILAEVDNVYDVLVHMDPEGAPD